MATVQRANVILQVSDDADVLQKYRDKGYNIIDNDTGKVLEKAVPHEAGALQALVTELQETVDAQAKEIAELQKKLKSATKPKTKKASTKKKADE